MKLWHSTWYKTSWSNPFPLWAFCTNPTVRQPFCAKINTYNLKTIGWCTKNKRRSSVVVIGLDCHPGGRGSILTRCCDSLGKWMYLRPGQPMPCEGNWVPLLWYKSVGRYIRHCGVVTKLIGSDLRERTVLPSWSSTVAIHHRLCVSRA